MEALILQICLCSLCLCTYPDQMWEKNYLADSTAQAKWVWGADRPVQIALNKNREVHCNANDVFGPYYLPRNAEDVYEHSLINWLDLFDHLPLCEEFRIKISERNIQHNDSHLYWKCLSYKNNLCWAYLCLYMHYLFSLGNPTIFGAFKLDSTG